MATFKLHPGLGMTVVLPGIACATITPTSQQ